MVATHVCVGAFFSHITAVAVGVVVSVSPPLCSEISQLAIEWIAREVCTVMLRSAVDNFRDDSHFYFKRNVWYGYPWFPEC